jgi:hypothetical protein
MLYRENIVWLPYLRVYGELISLGAWYSTIKYVTGGVEFEVFVDNEEFVILDDLYDEDEWEVVDNDTDD